ncbi:uncharacterized protein N7458_002607 [Penicillium daleae]|uniref:Uncharacterized protein n=1 Tax=Penicillium daleae TaxID=63821 RepID=A0AAD6CD56_9EURO|nr:uncharacterized protein N7458_002607 [Penicillium daleae]KAJ5461055.1 hypothetical protein N7458_002607 [Penicillium daleae]
MPCLQKLSKDDQYSQLKHTKLRRHLDRNSNPFEPCQPGRACIRVQELQRPGIWKKNDIRALVQDLKPTKAVAFENLKRLQQQPCPGPAADDRAGAGMWNSVPLSLMIVIIVMLTTAFISAGNKGTHCTSTPEYLAGDINA